MEEVFDYLRKIFKPYSNLPIFNELPKEGIPKQEILELLSKILNKENLNGKKALYQVQFIMEEKIILIF